MTSVAEKNRANREFWLANEEILRKLWGDGWSSGEIVDHFGGAVTRNAVMGKVFRLGLIRNPGTSNRTNPRPKRTGRRIRSGGMIHTKMRAARIKKTSLPMPQPPEPVEPMHIKLIDLGEKQCRYPYGDSPFTHCGHPIKARNLCAYHYDKCWFKMERKRK